MPALPPSKTHRSRPRTRTAARAAATSHGFTIRGMVGIEIVAVELLIGSLRNYCVTNGLNLLQMLSSVGADRLFTEVDVWNHRQANKQRIVFGLVVLQVMAAPAIAARP